MYGCVQSTHNSRVQVRSESTAPQLNQILTNGFVTTYNIIHVQELESK